MINLALEVVRFPFAYEEDPAVFKERPVVVVPLGSTTALVLVVKVTSHGPRPEFPGEVRIEDWAIAGLTKPSVARCSKALAVSPTDLVGLPLIGTLSLEDSRAVFAGLVEAGVITEA